LFRQAESDASNNGLPGERWLEEEILSSAFPDERLGKRFCRLTRQLASKLGQSIPLACQDWANVKAAYRFLSNPRVDEAAILAGHFGATRERVHATEGTILIVHDTTQFTYARESTQPIGVLHRSYAGYGKDGRPRLHTVGGVLMHSSLAMTTEGLPLGLAAIKFWTRSAFKGTNALRGKVNATRVPIEIKESLRWLENLQQATGLLGEPERYVHIGDRESDIYELFCAAEQSRTHFLLRTCADRVANDGRQTLSQVLQRAKAKVQHRVEVRDAKGKVSEAIVTVKYVRTKIYPPEGKQKKYPPLIVTAIHARELTAPHGRERLDWKLLTNLPVRSRKEAVEKLTWYATRWKVETFHKVLKSGCRAEASRLRTAERIVNLIAVFCILSWRIFWMTMMNRVAPTAPPTVALTPVEMHVLDRLLRDQTAPNRQPRMLSAYLTKIARLGGYLGRSKDPPPGNMVMWRGLSRLTDIAIGFTAGVELVGN
jgi:hypothetical protein